MNEGGAGWTLEALKEHLEALRREDQRALRLLADEYDRRLAVLNEAHERADALRVEFLSKVEYERRHTELVRRISALEVWKANITGRAIGLAVVGALFVAVVSTLVGHLAK